LFAEYSTGVVAALAGPSATTAPESSSPARTPPASSLLTIFVILFTEVFSARVNPAFQS
jgi:hypothetical protein